MFSTTNDWFNWTNLRNEVKVHNSGGTEALFNEPNGFSNDDNPVTLSTAMTGTNPAVLNDHLHT